MPRVFTSKSQKIGQIGEKLAALYLTKQGFSIKDINYTKPWGEIDIVALKDNIIHFIEVKSVSRESKSGLAIKNKDLYRPEENLSRDKLRKLYRTIGLYLKDKNMTDRVEWQLDLICVYLEPSKKMGKVKYLENI